MATRLLKAQTCTPVLLQNPTEVIALKMLKRWAHPELQIKVSYRGFVSSKSIQICTTLKFQPVSAFIMDSKIKQVLSHFFQHKMNNPLYMTFFLLMEDCNINALFNSKHLNNWYFEILPFIHKASQFLLKCGGRKTTGTFFKYFMHTVEL